MSDTCCTTAAPSCALTCEELTCELDAIKSNITKLETRTTDLRDLFNIVTTEAGLIAALLEGGLILIGRSIELSDTVTASVDDTTLQAFAMTDEPIVLSYPHVSGEDHDVLLIEAENVTVDGIEFTTGHPLANDEGDLDCGIRISDSSTIDCSGFRIQNCKFYDLQSPIRREGATNSVQVRNGLIYNCQLEGFCSYGILLNYNFHNMQVSKAKIKGRVNGQTHDVTGNGIWIGNFADYTVMDDCYVEEVDRHAYETWNAQGNTGGNINPMFRNLRVGVIGQNTGWGGFQGSYGISSLGTGTITIQGCTIKQSHGIGIECPPDDTNTARYNIVGNDIQKVVSASIPVLLSLDSVGGTAHTIRANVTGNTFGKAESSTALQPQYGIQIYAGCNGVKITNNQFKDSGNQFILANGDGVAVFEGITISDNDFDWTADATIESYNVSVNLISILSTAVVKNNNVYRGAGAAVGYFRASGVGTYLTGGTANAPLVSTAGDIDLAGDTNLEIERL